MPNVEYVNRFIKHNKEETICATVARAEKQFADGLVKRSALGSKRTTLGSAGKTFRALTRPPDPVARRTGRLAANIAIGRPEIALSRGSNDDAVSHLSDRVFPFQFVKHLIRRPARAFARLSKTSADARHGIQLTGHLLIGRRIEQHG